MSTNIPPQADSPPSPSAAKDHRLAMLAPPEDRDAAIEVMRDSLGFNTIDARVRLHHVPGVWSELFDSSTADRGAKLLNELGAEAYPVCAADVPDLKSAQTLHHVRCRPEGFVIVSLSGDPGETIPWERLSVLSIADVEGLRENSPNPFVDGVFRRAVGGGPLDKKSEFHGFELWLLCESPFRAFRMDAEQMNYEYLGERLSTSGGENFGHLVSDICQFAPQLILTKLARSYRENPFQGLHHLPSPDVHREAVAAYWAIHCRETHQPPAPQQTTSVEDESQRLKTSENPRPHPSQTPNNTEEVMNTSKVSSESAVFRKEHASLDHEIADWRTWWRELSELGKPQFGEMGDRLTHLREHLAAHFAHEESQPGLDLSLSLPPRDVQKMAALRDEHKKLLGELDRIVDRLSGCSAEYDCWGKAREDFETFLNRLNAHEEAEETLLDSLS